MNDRRENEFRPPRFALLLLGLLGIGIAWQSPCESWWLDAIVGGSLAYLAWRFHGVVVATIVVAFTFVHLRAAPATSELIATSCFLLAHAGGLMAWSTAFRGGRWSWCWPIALLVGSVSMLLVQQSRVLNEVQIRLLQATMALWLVVGFAGGLLLARRVGAMQTLVLGGTAVGVPTIVLLSLHYAGLLNKPILDATLWKGQAHEWLAWAHETIPTNETWCWAPVWLIGPLLLFGWWRAWVRGQQQWRSGDAPLGWLFGIGTIMGVLATLPDDVLLLHLEAIIVPLFGVIDAGVALVERIQLSPPPVGPADTPRVR